MLMTPPTALLDQLYEQTHELRRSILATNHEPSAEHTLFYVSPRGNDSNDGRSPSAPIKTLTALDQLDLPAGSEVLFERGGIWRGRINARSGVTYSSYGSGDKPRIYGSPLDGAKTGHWREIIPGVWRYSRKLTDDCGGIVFDGVKCGIKITQRFEPDGSVVDHATCRAVARDAGEQRAARFGGRAFANLLGDRAGAIRHRSREIEHVHDAVFRTQIVTEKEAGLQAQ